MARVARAIQTGPAYRTGSKTVKDYQPALGSMTSDWLLTTVFKVIVCMGCFLGVAGDGWRISQRLKQISPAHAAERYCQVLQAGMPSTRIS